MISFDLENSARPGIVAGRNFFKRGFGVGIGWIVALLLETRQLFTMRRLGIMLQRPPGESSGGIAAISLLAADSVRIVSGLSRTENKPCSKRYFKIHFNADANVPLLYHLITNTSLACCDDAAKPVSDAMPNAR